MSPEELFIENQALVPFTLSQLLQLHKDQDLLQEGYIGLWNACLTFDESKGCKFSTYATYCIRNAILKALYKSNQNNKLQVISLQTPVSTQDSLEEELTIQDTIADQTTTLDALHTIIILNQLKDSLVGTRKKVLEKRMKEKSITEIAQDLHISKQRVTKILQDLRRKYVY